MLGVEIRSEAKHVQLYWRNILEVVANSKEINIIGLLHVIDCHSRTQFTNTKYRSINGFRQ